MVCVFTALYGAVTLNIKGAGSCLIISWIWASFTHSLGGIYTGKMFISLCRVTLTAVACKVVVRFILLWGASFLIGIDVP